MLQGMIWNTGYHITYEGDKDLTDSVIAVCHQIENSVSIFTEGSLVNRINSGEDSTTDSIFEKIYSESKRIHKESHGYFDPTLAPLIEAYGFAGKEGSIPNKNVTDSIMQFVGLYKTVLKDGHLIKEDPRIQFNFSAIAKGYGCDAVGMMLQRNGCENYLVEIGGEVSAHGISPSGGKWRIQVDKPLFSSEGEIHVAQNIIEITDCGVATSGNYRNFKRNSEGKILGHTFNPFTGEPTENDILSSTIIAPTCMEADAYATACMAMGYSKAKEMVERLDMPALLISSSGEEWMTESFKKLCVK